jgi:chloramphenicol 3-O phosphotransferase
MQQGKIIFLNGITSSGKTTIANELIKVLGEPYFILSFDKFLTNKMRLVFDKDSKERENLISAFHHTIQTFSECSVNVIVDHVLIEYEWYEECSALLADLPVVYVGVYCPLEVLEERESQREDRIKGMARQQYEIVHSGKSYDLTLDTSLLTPHECAEKIKVVFQLR